MSAVIADLAVAAAAAQAARTQQQQRADAIKRARELLAPAMGEREAPEYPMHALGPLADACAAIAEHGQVQPAMVGQCLLGAASLLTQGLFNAQSLTGKKPLSLYLLTLGDSGDGKSTAQGPALRAVHDWQRKAGQDYRKECEEYEREMAKRKKGDDLPTPPLAPYRVMRDATVEGLRSDLDHGVCSQGIFSDEAAAILSGYGMSAEHRSKTAAVFTGLWDDGHLSVSRAVRGRVERYGRRVAAHWLIQPMAAGETLGDPLLAQLGFWPRFLTAWPSPQQPRLARPFEAHKLPAVKQYWMRCEALLSEPLPDDAGECPVLELTDDARGLLGRAFEDFEKRARRGDLRSVKPFALRAAEQIARVAGVLACFAGRHSVANDDVRSALQLVMYSLRTWRDVLDRGAADPTPANASRLYEWLTARPGSSCRLVSILKDGPACTRSKDKRDAALDLLVEHGLAERVADTAQALYPPEDGA